MNPSRIGQIGVPAAIITAVVMMVVPLPAAILDFLLVLNLAGAVLILLVSMSVNRALDFSVFPSILLIATMFRLSLNVSATRLVLLDGFAGNVIEAFGHFVIGGSIIVGLVIFMILLVIQFVVITNGAGRVAEVGARFTLDAMPGKQMAIDADLNSGLIDEDQARKRRREVSEEADFYGAMDGASKFVKGDAIAAIVITIINLFGGFLIGVVQRGMSITDAIENYSLLSVGDGLVSQIPALLISVASGLIVTRAASEHDMGSDMLSQFGRQTRTLKIASVAIGTMAIIPGLPKIPFITVGALLWFASTRYDSSLDSDVTVELAEPIVNKDTPERLASDMRVEPLELEIAYDLMDMVDTERGGDLLDRVRALRRKIAMDLGIVIPPVRTRDNIDLPAGTYTIRVHGVEIGRGEAPYGMALLIGDNSHGFPGRATHEPVFNMAATWIPSELSSQAEIAGETVVDRSSVVTTHLAEIVRLHASRLLSRQDVKMLVDLVKSSDPAVTDELSTSQVSLSDVQHVLQVLLDEQVAIRDLVRILEAISEKARTTKEPESLVEAVRQALGPAISAAHSVAGRLPIITIEPLVEHALVETLRSGDSGSFLALDPETTERFINEVATASNLCEQRGDQPVLVCAGQLRPAIRRLLKAIIPNLPVLSYTELGTQLQLENVGVVNLAQPAAV